MSNPANPSKMSKKAYTHCNTSVSSSKNCNGARCPLFEEVHCVAGPAVRFKKDTRTMITYHNQQYTMRQCLCFFWWLVFGFFSLSSHSILVALLLPNWKPRNMSVELLSYIFVNCVLFVGRTESNWCSCWPFLSLSWKFVDRADLNDSDCVEVNSSSSIPRGWLLRPSCSLWEDFACCEAVAVKVVFSKAI